MERNRRSIRNKLLIICYKHLTIPNGFDIMVVKDERRLTFTEKNYGYDEKRKNRNRNWC